MNWEVRAYQKEAIAECVDAFANGRRSVMLESPVGSGKTYMGLEIVRHLEERLGRRLRVAWVAPRHRLLEQVMEANRDLHRLLVRPVSLFEKTPPNADLVVLDEAHHEATQSCVLLYEKIKAPLTLGLSATPLRTDRMKLSFQLTVTTCGIGRLVREGFLAPTHSYLLPHWGPRVAAECYLADQRRWGKSLVFFSTISDCLWFRDALAAGGVRCEVVTGESDKDAQLARFASGEVPVVANVSMLTEGFDQPDVATVFARDASRVPTIQMCGRGLRLADGKDHCNIVQSSGTPYLFERVTPPLRSFRLHNGHWLALQDKTSEIEETLRRSIQLLEERERRRQEARRARPRAAVGRTPPPAESMEIEPGVKRAYQGFYWLFELCNRFAWNGTLPPCLLSFNCSARPSHVAGFAQPLRPHPRLSLNLRICSVGETASFLPILLHEMTHIWQFSRGSRGGHGRDFRRELLRVGVNESPGAEPIVHGSAAWEIAVTAQRLHPELAGLLRALVGHPPPSQHALEDAIFREYLSARGSRAKT